MTIDYPNKTPTLEEIESGGSFFVCFDQRGTPYLFNFREGHCWGLRRVARNEGVRREVIMEAAGGDIADDGVNYGDIGGGDGGDVSVDPVPVGQLDADLGQGTVRKTVRNLDQGAVAAIREITGASSDAEAVRKAVALAKDVLVKD